MLLAVLLSECVLLSSICPPSSRVSPFCLRQSPTGRATLGARTLSGVVSLCHLSLWCKKNRAHQRLRTNSGAWHSLRGAIDFVAIAITRRRCSSNSVFEIVSAYISTPAKAIKNSLLTSEFFVYAYANLLYFTALDCLFHKKRQGSFNEKTEAQICLLFQ